MFIQLYIAKAPVVYRWRPSPCIQGYFANSFSVPFKFKKGLLYCLRACRKPRFFFPDTWRDPFVWLHLFLHQHWFTRAYLQRSSRKMSGRHTQNTTRFNLCGTTSHTCPHKCKGSFLLHTRHAQDEFQGIFLRCEAPRDFPLHGTAAVVVVVIVVEKPVPAVSYFCFFLLGFWLCLSTAPLLISITWQCAYVVKKSLESVRIFFFRGLKLDF